MEPNDKNNLAYWYPKLQASGVPTPETEIVQCDFVLGRYLFNEEKQFEPNFKALAEKLGAIATRFGLPAFLRTGYGSGKHDWERTCWVTDASKIGQHIYNLAEWSGMVDFIGLPIQTWVVRKRIPTVAPFTAFYRHMPVTRERRYFFKDGKVIGHHPYWPPHSITKPSTPDWGAKLAVLNDQSAEEIAFLTERSERVATQFQGAWSLDWLYSDELKEWFAIDMALAHRSFCWHEHPTAPRPEQINL